MTKRKERKEKKKREYQVKYNPLFCDMLIEFFSPPFYLIKDITITKADGTQIDKTEREACDPLFLTDFGKTIGVKRGANQLFSRWKDKHPEFTEALKEAKELETQRFIVNGAQGLYNPAFSIFTLKNIAGWRDKTEHELTGKDGGAILLRVSKEDEAL